MAENKKKKRPKKRHKPYPPLSKADRTFYNIFHLTSALILLGSIVGYIFFYDKVIFRNPDILAYADRWTMLMMLGFFFVGGIIVFEIDKKKHPVFGNKKIDYFNTTYYRFTLPLYDKRYQNLENCKKAKKAFYKKTAIYSVVLMILFCIGLLGYTGRHEFDDNGITTYSIFNNPTEEYSYDEVEAYELRATKRYYKHGFYYEIFLKLNLQNGEEFFIDYDYSRDGKAMIKIKNQLEGKPEIIDDSYLEDFIKNHTLTDDEIKTLYELFEK